MARLISKKLRVCVGLAVVVLMVVFVAWPPLSPTTRPNIFVLGHTNDPTTGPLFLFSVTNQSASQMIYLVGTPVIKTAGSWPPTPELRGLDNDLSPHQATNFAVKVPTETNLWRVPVYYGYLPSGTERWRGEIRYNMRVNWIRLKHREIPKWVNGQMFDVYLVYSPEVTTQPDAEPTNATNPPDR